VTQLETALVSLGVGCCVALAVGVNHANIETGIDRIEADLRRRLRTLRLKFPQLRLWIRIWIALTVAAAVLVSIAAGSPVFGLLIAVLMSIGPWYLVARAAKARKEKIEDQLADSMVMFSSAVRAGLSLPQALELLAHDSPKPIRQEFAQMIGEYQLGKPLERTLEEAKVRLESENFVLFAAALLASRESGGRLNETVERIARAILEMQRLERKIQSETAQAKKSAIYMAAVPPFVLVVYAWLDPNNVSLLFVTLPGQLMLATAVVLEIVAYFWALKILNPDI
jgi:tight adherence protein B